MQHTFTIFNSIPRHIQTIYLQSLNIFINDELNKK